MYPRIRKKFISVSLTTGKITHDPAIQPQNMNLRDTLIHVYQETQQECLSIGYSKNLETTLISIKEDKYINYSITAFADEGKTMHL